MNYILKPSLVHISLVKIAVTLWDQQDIRDLITKISTEFRGTQLKKNWSKVENLIVKKVPELPLPKLLKEKTLSFVIYIGVQMLNWIEYHYRLNLNIGIPDKFYWTPQGTINKKKTAKVFIDDESIDSVIRYRLACIYCLEDSVQKLWAKMPEDHRKIFYNEENPTYDTQEKLVIIWTYDIKGEINKVHSLFNLSLSKYSSPYQYAFESAALDGNEVGTKYFLQKLNLIERKESFKRITGDVLISAIKFKDEECSNIFCVLLSQMSYEEQVELYKNYTYRTLSCFLDWPRQIFFMEVVDRVWDLLKCNLDAYETLLKAIVYKLDHYKDFNYNKFFRKTWTKGSDDQKKFVLNGCFISYALPILLNIRDLNSIKLIFQHATDTVKKRFICSIRGDKACESLVDSEEWDVLEFFVRECLSSKEEMKKFKKDFGKRTVSGLIFSRDDLETRKRKLKKFFLLIDNCFCESSKRNCVEDNNSAAKRLCKND